MPLAIALIGAIRSARRGDRAAFLLSLGLPFIVVFTVVPLWGERGFPHWTMPGWFFAFPLLGAWFAAGGAPWLRPRTWSVLSGATFAAFVLVVVSHSSSGWIRRVWPTLSPAGDPTLEGLSWAPLRTTPPFLGQPPDFIVAAGWVDGAKPAAAFDGSIPVLVFSDDPRQFAFSHQSRVRSSARTPSIVLGAARSERDLPLLAPFFAQLGAPETLWLGRGPLAEVPLVAVRATDLLRPYPMPYPVESAMATVGPDQPSR